MAEFYTYVVFVIMTIDHFLTFGADIRQWAEEEDGKKKKKKKSWRRTHLHVL